MRFPVSGIQRQIPVPAAAPATAGAVAGEKAEWQAQVFFPKQVLFPKES